MSIITKNLSMEYTRGVRALDNVNLDLEKGMYGLLGQNGAGKTTLMRILTTLIKPTSGEALIDGLKLEPGNYDKIKSIIGYLPQDFGMYPGLSVYEAMDYIAIMNKIGTKERKGQIEELLAKVNLSNEAHKKVKQLSGGMKRRLGIAQAMLNSPRILIIDEPTAGLDPEERIRIRNMLTEFGRDRTVLLSTHIVEDIASTCKNSAILEKGKLKYFGSVKELIGLADGKVWKCKVKDNQELETIKRKYLIISNIYMNEYIEVRLLSNVMPEFGGEAVEPGLEDAYMLICKGVGA